MPERDQITEPSELIFLPRPSWAPAFLALGAMLIVNGIFGEGFLFRGWVYMIVGALVALGALRSLVSGAAHDYFERPRRQRSRAAVLPADTFRAPPKG